MITRGAVVLMVFFAGCGTTMDKNGQADSTKEVQTVTLQYADAGEVMDTLEILLGDPPSPPTVADPRTNSIIILGSPEEISLVKKVISVMDKESTMTVK